jgi:hypothetical protein
MWGLWWTKRHWGWFSSSTSASLGKQSTDCSTLIIILGWYNNPFSGLNNSVLGSTAPQKAEKKGASRICLKGLMAPKQLCTRRKYNP